MKQFEDFLIENDSEDNSRYTHLVVTGTTYVNIGKSRLRNIKKTKRHFTVFELDHDNKTKKEVAFKAATGEGREGDDKVQKIRDVIKKKYPAHLEVMRSNYPTWYSKYETLR